MISKAQKMTGREVIYNVNKMSAKKHKYSSWQDSAITGGFKPFLLNTPKQLVFGFEQIQVQHL